MSRRLRTFVWLLASLLAMAVLVRLAPLAAGGSGITVVSPAAIELPLPRAHAAEFTTFDVVIRLDRALVRGTRLRISQGHVLGDEVLWDDVLRYRLPDWQTVNPRGENYLSIISSAGEVDTLEVRGSEGSSTLVAAQRELPRGTTMTLRFGDRALGSRASACRPTRCSTWLIFAREGTPPARRCRS
ncbi:MAG: hypothetical protein U1E76_12020 [Planctomycetota bacterium]